MKLELTQRRGQRVVFRRARKLFGRGKLFLDEDNPVNSVLGFSMDPDDFYAVRDKGIFSEKLGIHDPDRDLTPGEEIMGCRACLKKEGLTGTMALAPMLDERGHWLRCWLLATANLGPKTKTPCLKKLGDNESFTLDIPEEK